MKQSTTSKLVLVGIIAGSFVAVINGCNKSKNGGELVIKMKSSPSGQSLAQIGEISLSVDELRQDFLDRQGTFRGAPHLNTEKKRTEYIENQVMQWALFQEAIELDYFNKDLEVKRNIIKMTVQKLMRDKLSEAQDSYVPNDEELKAYYEKNPIHFNREDALKVAFIAVPFGADQKSAESVAQLLFKDATEKIKDANIKEFARLAINFAQSNKAGSSGKLETNESDYLEREAFDAKFGKDAFTKISDLKGDGQLGPLLSSNNSYYIVMKTGSRKKLNESFEEAKPKIAKRIAFEKRGEVYEKYLADIRKKYKVQIHQDLLAELSNDLNPPADNNANGGANAPSGDAIPTPKTAPTPTPSTAQQVPNNIKAVAEKAAPAH
jgi:hypothetical protein